MVYPLSSNPCPEVSGLVAAFSSYFLSVSEHLSALNSSDDSGAARPSYHYDLSSTSPADKVTISDFALPVSATGADRKASALKVLADVGAFTSQ